MNLSDPQLSDAKQSLGQLVRCCRQQTGQGYKLRGLLYSLWNGKPYSLLEIICLDEVLRLDLLTVLELTVLELTVLELTVLELTVLELTVLELTVLESFGANNFFTMKSKPNLSPPDCSTGFVRRENQNEQTRNARAARAAEIYNANAIRERLTWLNAQNFAKGERGIGSRDRERKILQRRLQELMNPQFGEINQPPLI